MFKKLPVVIFIFVTLAFQSVSAEERHAPSLKAESIRYLIKTKENIRLQGLRETDVYKRIYKICSKSGIRFGQLKYTIDGIKQVFSISNPQELNRVLFSREKLSRELTEDLNHPAFYQVMSDCGYTVEQSGMFVLALISADLSGKLIGTIGMITFFKKLGSSLKIIKTKSPSLYYAIVGSSIISSTYAYFRPHLEKNKSSTGEQNVTIASESDLEKHFPKEVTNSKVLNSDNDSKALTLKALKLKIKVVSDELRRPVKSAIEIQKLESRLHLLKVKYAAIEMS